MFAAWKSTALAHSVNVLSNPAAKERRSRCSSSLIEMFTLWTRFLSFAMWLRRGAKLRFSTGGVGRTWRGFSHDPASRGGS
jgi:hypothetical protein